MSSETSQEIRSKVTNEGTIEISIASVDKPKPSNDEVLIKIGAAPINPSDLGLLLSFAADLNTINVTMRPRLEKPMPVGNEGAGLVEDAGANVKDLIGKTVGLAGGAMYSQY